MNLSDFGMDGMRCDNQGNIYVCRYDAGKVVVINPARINHQRSEFKGQKTYQYSLWGKGWQTMFCDFTRQGMF